MDDYEWGIFNLTFHWTLGWDNHGIILLEEYTIMRPNNNKHISDTWILDANKDTSSLGLINMIRHWVDTIQH